MATWIAHIRIAEYFMEKYNELNNDLFLVGNIGPDCGVPNKDWTVFTPNKTITHWLVDGKIDINDYKEKYLNIKDARHPFYLGYYIHLLTDIKWMEFMTPIKTKLLKDLNAEDNNEFVWKLKEDWYGQDHLYLKHNIDSIFFKSFTKIKSFKNNYFDFYPEDAFIRQIKYISNFYLSFNENLDREFPYLSTEQMDGFVNSTIEYIEVNNKLADNL